MANVARRQMLDVWCSCSKCKDSFSVVFWAKLNGNGSYRVRLERSTAVQQVSGELFHRIGHCGGRLRVFDLPGPVFLEED